MKKEIDVRIGCSAYVSTSKHGVLMEIEDEVSGKLMFRVKLSFEDYGRMIAGRSLKATKADFYDVFSTAGQERQNHIVFIKVDSDDLLKWNDERKGDVANDYVEKLKREGTLDPSWNYWWHSIGDYRKQTKEGFPIHVVRYIDKSKKEESSEVKS